MWQQALSVGQKLKSVALRYGALGRRQAGLPSAARSWRWRSLRLAGWGESPAGTVRSAARLARLEAVLFLAREPLTSRKLAQLASLADGTEARTLISRIREKYNQRGSGFQVEEVAGGFQLLTRPPCGKWLRRLLTSPMEIQLSGPALETMVVVAYRQPVLRAEIEAIRGVQCGEILRQLMDRDLVKIVGRSHDLGRPFLYGTSKRFLQVFGLRHLDELPRAEQLKKSTVQPCPPVENQPQARHDTQTHWKPERQTEEVSDVIQTHRTESLLAEELRNAQPTTLVNGSKQSVDEDGSEFDESQYEYVDEEEIADDKSDEEDEEFEDDDDEEDDEEYDDEEDEWEEVEDEAEDEAEEEEEEEEEDDEDDDDWDDEDEDDWDDDELDDYDEEEEDEEDEEEEEEKEKGEEP